MFQINIKHQLHMQGTTVYREQREVRPTHTKISQQIKYHKQNKMKEKNKDSKKKNENGIPKNSIPVQIFGLFGI